MHGAFRECVRQAWGTSIHSFYGTTETGGIGTECALGDGVHFDPREILLTLENPRWLDENTVEGEVLLTTTGGHTHNVVKYRVGDRLRVTTAKCPCGETMPRLWHRERTNDVFMVGGEKFRSDVFVEAFREVDPTIELLSIYVEDGADDNAACRLRVVVPDSARDREEELYEVLKHGLFELGAFYRYRLVEFLIEFQTLQAFSKRKVDRVVDRRRYIGGHPNASVQSSRRPAEPEGRTSPGPKREPERSRRRTAQVSKDI
jgi:phenylacetate-coenzyme A ligase PaaK-like adenylate-forming protein